MVVKAQPVMGPDGAPALAINVLEDVTVTKLAERAQRFLADVSSALAETLDDDATVRVLERVAVPAVAARAVIDEAPPSDPDRGETVRAVLRTGAPQLRPDLIVAPLVARGRTLAALSLIRDTEATPYDAHDLEVAVGVRPPRGPRAGQRATVLGPRPHGRGAAGEPAAARAAGDPRPRGGRALPRGGHRHDVGGDFYDLFEAATAVGRSSSATSAARAPRRPRSPRWRATRSAPAPCSAPTRATSSPAQRRPAAAAHRRGLLHGRPRALRHRPDGATRAGQRRPPAAAAAQRRRRGQADRPARLAARASSTTRPARRGRSSSTPATRRLLHRRRHRGRRARAGMLERGRAGGLVAAGAPPARGRSPGASSARRRRPPTASRATTSPSSSRACGRSRSRARPRWRATPSSRAG